MLCGLTCGPNHSLHPGRSILDLNCQPLSKQHSTKPNQTSKLLAFVSLHHLRYVLVLSLTDLGCFKQETKASFPACSFPATCIQRATADHQNVSATQHGRPSSNMESLLLTVSSVKIRRSTYSPLKQVEKSNGEYDFDHSLSLAEPSY